MQQALMVAPQTGVIHSGFRFGVVVAPSLPYGRGSVEPCMWGIA
jgi:hypothetical protein